MAIGLGRMMGIEFLENFNAPYISRNFTEFWRRWHISLSNFMKEYLYVPLGGNRASELRTYVNLWVVFLVSGFWHGAAWNFIVWGAYHGFFLSLDKLFRKSWGGRIPACLAIPSTFVLIMFGWVFFRAETLPAALAYFRALFGWAGPSPVPALGALLDPRAIAVLVVAALASFLPALRIGRLDLDSLSFETLGLGGWIGAGALALVLLVLSSMSLAAGGFNPFIYFRF
jgi:alginate O-acetyltransferase complex protein AlgI